MGLVPNNDLMRVNTKSPKFFLMLKLPYTKSGVKLLKSNFLTSPIRADGPS